MSKRDFNYYYWTIQKQYISYIKLLENFKKITEERKLTQEEYDWLSAKYNQIIQEVQPIIEKYNIISEAAYYLNLPKDKDYKEKLRNQKRNKEYEDYFRSVGVNVESINDGSKNVLDDFDKFIKEVTTYFESLKEGVDK